MNKIEANDLTMPAPTTKYLTKTLNNMGMVTSYIDKYSAQFIAYAGKQKSPVLELGAGYGPVTIAALNAGATVIANDLDPQHLQILYNQTPVKDRERLTLLPGKFPQILNLPDESISGCYIARMLGYLETYELQEGFKKLFACLKPNAKLFIVSASLYAPGLSMALPIYEQRLLANDEWPGHFTNMKSIVPEAYQPYVPDRLNFLDEKVLTRELNHAGFIAEESHFLSRMDYPSQLRLDGREGIVTIARKP